MGMRTRVLIGSVALGAVLASGCKVKKHLDIIEANEADATFVLEYEHGFERYAVQWDEAEEEALERCGAWGYSAVEFAGVGTIECIETYQRNVSGARPPGQSEEPGMGTPAAERERSRRGVGTVGASVARPMPPGAEYGCVYWRVTYLAHCTE